MKVKQNIYFFIFVIVLNISKLSMAADIDYQIYEIDYQFDHPWSSVTLPNGDILITGISVINMSPFGRVTELHG